MKKSKEFHDYIIHDVMGHIAGINSRVMFGGYGIYQHGTIFGIIVNGVLYFKVNESNKKEFEGFGSKPFSYKSKDGKNATMSYWEVPEEIMESPALLALWIDRSVAVSLASKEKSRKA